MVMKNFYSKKEICDLIKEAEREVTVLGAATINLPWETLTEEIASKFMKDDDFTLKIVFESENTIAEDELIAGKTNFLSGVKSGAIKDLREKLKAKAKECAKTKYEFNIEPIEDIKKKDYANVEKIAEHDYMLEIIRSLGIQDEVRAYLKDVLYKYFNGDKGKIKESIAKGLLTNKIDLDNIVQVQKQAQEESEKVIEAILNKALEYYSDKNKMDFTKGIVDVNKIFASILNDGENKIIREDEQGASGWFVCVKSEEIEKLTRVEIKEYVSSDEENNYRLKAQRSLVEKRKTYIKETLTQEYTKDRSLRQRLFILNCYLPIPIPMIKIDDNLFVSQALTKFENLENFQLVGAIVKSGNGYESKSVKVNKKDYRSQWLDSYVDYYTKYCEEGETARRYCTEETEKRDRLEVIDMFNENRVKIGTGPRDAFLANDDIVKSVVWGLLFTRDGRMLIHKRGSNAKDNRNLWDKSVGGHVSVQDLDTGEAIKREITEELFTIENNGQGGFGKEDYLKVNMEKIIYLGEWNSKRFPSLTKVPLEADEHYMFLLNPVDARRNWIYTSRVLPDGSVVKAKCFADIYLSVVSEEFDIKKLQNSKFALVTPDELKECINKGKIIINNVEEPFAVTSDLEYLVKSTELWNRGVSVFADLVKKSFENK